MAETKTKLSDEQILGLLQPDIDRAENIQDDLASQRENSYDRFRCELYGNERDGWSQTVAPIVWVQHQSAISSLIEIFTDEFFILKSDNAERASNFQKLIRYQMFRKQDGYKRLYDFLFNAGLYHYAVFKVYYKEDYDLEREDYDRLTADQLIQLYQEDQNRQVTKYTEAVYESVDPNTGEPVTEKVYEKVKILKKVIKYAGPAFEVVPPWEFAYSADCKITDWGGIEGRLVYHKKKITLDEIRKKENAGIFRKGTFAACKELAGSEHELEPDERAIKYDADDLTETITDSERSDEKDNLSKQLSHKECYVRLDIDGDGILEHCIVDTIEDEVIARAIENPYEKPCFRIGGMIPEPHKVNGIAPPEIVDYDQKIATNLIRFIQDMAAMSAYRNPITNDVRMQAMLQNRKPFDVILGDPTKIGEVPVQPPDMFILKAWELLKGEREETTGQPRLNQGILPDSTNKTAHGMNIVSQGGARRLRMSAMLMANGPIMGVIRDFIFINQKWRTSDPIKLLGTDITINPQDLDGEYDIEIDIGVSPAEKQMSAQQLDLLVQFGTQAGIPMGIMTPEHLINLQKRKYSLLGVNVDDSMKSITQFRQDQQAAAQKPKQTDWREYLQIDKIWTSLPIELQAMILSQMLGVQIPPQALAQAAQQANQVPPNPVDPNKVLDMQKQREQFQGKMALNQQEHAMSREQHGMNMQMKAMEGAVKNSGATTSPNA